MRLLLCLGLLCAQYSVAALRAGAARVEITPAADAALATSGYGSRVDGHKKIHDPLFVRALVLNDGANTVAIFSFDMLFVTEDFRARLTERIARDNGIPADAILLAATHTHGAPSLGPVKPEFESRRNQWRTTLEDRAAEAVRQAKAALVAARVGAGIGKAFVNTNRRARQASGGWGLGVNPEGPSDKTVGVIKVETLAGEPLAILINYAVHGTVMGPRNYEITGDLPGAAERFVEQSLGGNVVALWTSAASGDQNAIYGPGNDFGQVAILGRILGEEVVRVAASIRTSARAPLKASQRVVSCPGRKMTTDSKPHENRIAFADSEPVNIRLSLVQIGPIALAGVSGEVLTGIGEHLKRESPFSRTFMVTHANGASGYIPDDDAYAQVSYEIWVTKVKPGCAEKSIVNSFLEMFEENQQ